MPPAIATVIFAVGILGLFYLNRDGDIQPSKALWVPTAWLLITSSRPVSVWLGMAPRAGTGGIYLEGSPIDRAVYIVLVAAGLAVAISRGRQVGPILRKNWPVVLFFSYAAFSIFWSDFPFVTFKHWCKGIGDVLMVLIILTEQDPMDAIKRLITRIGFVLVPLSVLFIKYYPALGRTLTKGWAMEWTGVAMQKNSLGGLCLIVGLGFLWCIRAAHRDRENVYRTRRLWALGTVLGMVIWLLWMCNSITSIACLSMASGVMLLSERPAFRRNSALVHILVVAVLGIALYALFFQSSGALVEDLGRNPTLTGRTEVWSQVLSIPVNRWVGAGYESFWLGHRLEQIRSIAGFAINEAHNGYIEIFLNLGWVGVSLLTLLILTGYTKVVATLRANAEYGSLAVAFFLVPIIAGLTEAVFRMLASTWFFFLVANMSALEAWAGNSAVSTVEASPTSDPAPFEPQLDHVLGVGPGGGYRLRRFGRFHPRYIGDCSPSRSDECGNASWL